MWGDMTTRPNTYADPSKLTLTPLTPPTETPTVAPTNAPVIPTAGATPAATTGTALASSVFGAPTRPGGLTETEYQDMIHNMSQTAGLLLGSTVNLGLQNFEDGTHYTNA